MLVYAYGTGIQLEEREYETGDTCIPETFALAVIFLLSRSPAPTKSHCVTAVLDFSMPVTYHGHVSKLACVGLRAVARTAMRLRKWIPRGIAQGEVVIRRRDHRERATSVALSTPQVLAYMLYVVMLSRDDRIGG